jgi:glucokinase
MADKDLVLLGDLSIGSVFKLSLSEPGRRPQSVRSFGCASYKDFEDAIVEYLSDCGAPAIQGAAFSTSGWEVEGKVDLVHYGFELDRSDLRNLLGAARVSVVNDFVAKALAIPVLGEDERITVCGLDRHRGETVAVIGPTAGLGGAFLAPDGQGGWIASHCETGHADFAPCNELEIEGLRLMMKTYGHVSRERAVSAPGLCELWRCLAVIRGQTEQALSVDEILVQALVGDELACDAVRLQTELYAGIASDFALATGAKGGVYLCGSHLEAMGDLFNHHVFAERFYAKGRVSSYLRDLPVYRITCPEPEIAGLSTLFDDLIAP